jgi:hypothetical protein
MRHMQLLVMQLHVMYKIYKIPVTLGAIPVQSQTVTLAFGSTSAVTAPGLHW